MVSKISALIFALLLVPGCKTSSKSALSKSALNNEGIQPANPGDEFNSFLSKNHLDKLSISGPFDYLIYNRHEDLYDPKNNEFDSEYFPATFQLNHGSTMAGKIKLRGNMRFCDAFPHFKIKLEKSADIYGMRDYKIITHGNYEIDPDRTLDSISCSDAPLRNVPEGKAFNEYQVYGLAQKLVNYHFNVYPLLIDYIDPSAPIEVKSKFGFLLEDIADTAKRYNSEEKVFEAYHYSLGWFNASEDELSRVAFNIEFYTYLSDRYHELENASPNMSKKELSKKIQLITTDTKIISEIQKSSKPLAMKIKKNIESDQKNWLLKFDKESLIEAILFNIMVSNSDWSTFSLNPIHREEGIKNLMFIENNNGSIFTLPYDFDLAKIAEFTTPISMESYQNSLQSFIDNLDKNFSGFMVAELKIEGLRFKQKIDQLISQNELEKLGFSSAAKESIINFSSVLTQLSK